ncbi:InlB B-repeat-containing protein [Listeria cossartiae subsp. cayugensis]|uniref:InlB B-repeat-containing protein n=1 Tax=Listeria cossartiae subsp. cayugensis TaxID=2713505 RepID=A0ABU2INA4_9LIST|nr:InlB B-repeat-containing protein [Listeria cossartiae]MDT0049376.1 InlB B-repeat-containing protein [Listeria cossartiae subsp. cayugensis]MDT0065879.1 InlB B-repeat-containing protein [Listeria cossartiae subsp. cayugensis]MDT0078517.1 InlB B-repeat-containing protein [Listeria cossartiae subsp. cayugensis]MDT0081353.1 InlB B-repeat-containing protein [Listeria cossartiae subsp. cayugensis]MDT0088112.1 InlB B-repeat-containing protein [Listeria cossartiae subsp. cayugensis]
MKYKGKLFLYVILTLLIVGTSALFKIDAQAAAIPPAAIDQIFPDEALAKGIQNALGKSSTADTVTQTELDTITSLDVTAKGVHSLVGMNHVTNLSSFSVANNQVSDLGPLVNLNKLVWLELTGNKIENLAPLSNLTSLASLFLAGNKITDVSALAGLGDLVLLDISQNKISDIQPLNSLTKLSAIQMENQQIVNEALDFETPLTVPITVKNIAGQAIDPKNISDNGVTNYPNITWTLPSFIDKVSYDFNELDTVGNATNTFSGTVEQPLTQHFMAIFDIDGTETSMRVEAGTLIAEPATPTKEGYTFTGWYDAENGGNQWDFATDKMPANNLTLYAQFKINSYKATLKADSAVSTQTVEYQGLIQEPATPNKAGYTFTGWYDAPTGGNHWNFTSNKMPAHDVTLYAQFSKDASQGGAGSGTGGNEQVSNSDPSVGNQQLSNEKLPGTGDSGWLPISLIGAIITATSLLTLRRK